MHPTDRSPDSSDVVSATAQVQDSACLGTTEFTDSLSASLNNDSNPMDHAHTPYPQEGSSATMLAERRFNYGFWGATKINIPLSVPRRNAWKTRRSADASIAKVLHVQPHDLFTKSSDAGMTESTQDIEGHFLLITRINSRVNTLALIRCSERPTRCSQHDTVSSKFPMSREQFWISRCRTPGTTR